MLVEVIRRKIIKLDDPFVNFFSTLYIDFNFEDSLANIETLKEEIKKDVLLAPLEG